MYPKIHGRITSNYVPELNMRLVISNTLTGS